jgi:hypothetical protein
MKHVGRALAVGLVVFAGAAHAEIANGKVKIGVLTDLSGAYEQNSGNGSVESAKMAAEEFGTRSTASRSKSSPAITRTSRTSAPLWPIGGSTSTRSTP